MLVVLVLACVGIWYTEERIKSKLIKFLLYLVVSFITMGVIRWVEYY